MSTGFKAKHSLMAILAEKGGHQWVGFGRWVCYLHEFLVLMRLRGALCISWQCATGACKRGNHALRDCGKSFPMAQSKLGLVHVERRTIP